MLGEEFDRQVKGFQIGTVIGTVFYTPINMSAEIYQFRYVTEGVAGTMVATMIAEMRTSRSGTLTGTVDVVQVIPAEPTIRDSPSEAAVAKVEGGQHLVGVVVFPTGASGSIEGVVEYKYVPGRLTGA